MARNGRIPCADPQRLPGAYGRRHPRRTPVGRRFERPHRRPLDGMKLLFDENLSRRLVELVHDLFPGSLHITQAGLSSGALDREIWNYARRNGFAIITADTDFVTMAN